MTFHFTEHILWIKHKTLIKYQHILLVESTYSKASRYTASSCTDLDSARFWIGSKKPWEARFFIFLSLDTRIFEMHGFWKFFSLATRNSELLGICFPFSFFHCLGSRDAKILGFIQSLLQGFIDPGIIEGSRSQDF